MFTSGGQPELCIVCRGGGKGGGGSYQAAQPLPPTVVTDPVNGMSFTDTRVYGDLNNPGTATSGASAEDQLNAEIAQRQANEKATSDAATAQAQATAAQNESTFQTNRQNAYDTAMQQAIRAFTLQGADPNQYMASDIVPALQRQFQSVQDLDPNPTAAFPTNLGDTIVNQVLGGKRTQATNALNSIFTPTYADTQLPDTMTQDYVNSIVNQQFDPLSQQLINAQKRGTLSDPGYQAALNALNQKKSAATSQVNTLGQGILSTDRNALNDYISGAKSDASNLALAGNFDPNVYAGTAAGKVASDVSGFGGALQNAVGDTQFANLSDLINAGGAVQGSQNPNAANPGGTPTSAGAGNLSPAYMTDDQLAQQKRGLGNTGAF
jgi:hypothetical protein